MKFFIILTLLFVMKLVSSANLILEAPELSHNNPRQEETNLSIKFDKSDQAKNYVDELLNVMCNAKRSNGLWLVIQRRMDGSINFYRKWQEYKVGFGSIKGEFFIGLEILHRLTTCAPHELLIEMEDYDNEKRYAKYDLFEIGSESELYRLKSLGAHSGNVGNSLFYHMSQNFTTYDQDNDQDERNCAQVYKGAWWYKNCLQSNLNGEYGNTKYGEGVNWAAWHGVEYSLKFVEMKIRPKFELSQKNKLPLN